MQVPLRPAQSRSGLPCRRRVLAPRAAWKDRDRDAASSPCGEGEPGPAPPGAAAASTAAGMELQPGEDPCRPAMVGTGRASLSPDKLWDQDAAGLRGAGGDCGEGGAVPRAGQQRERGAGSDEWPCPVAERGNCGLRKTRLCHGGLSQVPNSHAGGWKGVGSPAT